MVEVLSPSTALYDRTLKAAALAEFGVPQLWLVDPKTRQLEAFELEQGSYMHTGWHSVPSPIPAGWPPVVAALGRAG